ncbi:uncharacterized protein [Diadema antillarum]|uniref:uncharacterized protein n=1 Tax=Diadema antillarum TaxID=105358 RepID=UPI003A867F8D
MEGTSAGQTTDQDHPSFPSTTSPVANQTSISVTQGAISVSPTTDVSSTSSDSTTVPTTASVTLTQGDTSFSQSTEYKRTLTSSFYSTLAKSTPISVTQDAVSIYPTTEISSPSSDSTTTLPTKISRSTIQEETSSSQITEHHARTSTQRTPLPLENLTSVSEAQDAISPTTDISSTSPDSRTLPTKTSTLVTREDILSGWTTEPSRSSTLSTSSPLANQTSISVTQDPISISTLTDIPPTFFESTTLPASTTVTVTLERASPSETSEQQPPSSPTSIVLQTNITSVSVTKDAISVSPTADISSTSPATISPTGRSTSVTREKTPSIPTQEHLRPSTPDTPKPLTNQTSISVTQDAISISPTADISPTSNATKFPTIASTVVTPGDTSSVQTTEHARPSIPRSSSPLANQTSISVTQDAISISPTTDISSTFPDSKTLPATTVTVTPERASSSTTSEQQPPSSPTSIVLQTNITSVSITKDAISVSPTADISSTSTATISPTGRSTSVTQEETSSIPTKELSRPSTPDTPLPLTNQTSISVSRDAISISPRTDISPTSNATKFPTIASTVVTPEDTSSVRTTEHARPSIPSIYSCDAGRYAIHSDYGARAPFNSKLVITTGKPNIYVCNTGCDFNISNKRYFPDIYCNNVANDSIYSCNARRYAIHFNYSVRENVCNDNRGKDFSKSNI